MYIYITWRRACTRQHRPRGRRPRSLARGTRTPGRQPIPSAARWSAPPRRPPRARNTRGPRSRARRSCAPLGTSPRATVVVEFRRVFRPDQPGAKNGLQQHRVERETGGHRHRFERKEGRRPVLMRWNVVHRFFAPRNHQSDVVCCIGIFLFEHAAGAARWPPVWTGCINLLLFAGGRISFWNTQNNHTVAVHPKSGRLSATQGIDSSWHDVISYLAKHVTLHVLEVYNGCTRCQPLPQNHHVA